MEIVRSSNVEYKLIRRKFLKEINKGKTKYSLYYRNTIENRNMLKEIYEEFIELTLNLILNIYK